MGTATPPPTLHRLRQTLAGIDPSLAPRLGERGAAASVSAPRSTRRSAAGSACGALHELAPTAPMHLAAASGFAVAVAALASRAARSGALGCHRLRGGRGRRTLRPRPRPVRDGSRAPPHAARAARGRCALGDGGGAALPRARRRCRRTHRRGRRGRSDRDAPARARRARRWRPRSPSSASARRRRRARRRPAGRSPRARAARRLRRSRPRAFRPFSPQEPARTVRPVDHRVGSS